jgi:hypothetical protein
MRRELKISKKMETKLDKYKVKQMEKRSHSIYPWLK